MRNCQKFLFGLLLGTWLVADTAEATVETKAQCSTLSHPGSTSVARRPVRRSTKRRTTPTKPKLPPTQTTNEPTTTEQPSGSTNSVPLGSGGGPTRVEFDAQLIKGQTTKAGEVQILERKDTELKSMVKRRTSFRDEIVHTVFPENVEGGGQ